MQEKDSIKYFQAIKEPHDPEFCILYLFFAEKREYYLLLGRGESKDFLDEEVSDELECSGFHEGEKSGNQGFKTTICTQDHDQDKTLSNEQHDFLQDSDVDDAEEADNDSPYRVKITLDQLFLSYLEDSYIMRGVELKDRYKDVLANIHFQ